MKAELYLTKKRISVWHRTNLNFFILFMSTAVNMYTDHFLLYYINILFVIIIHKNQHNIQNMIDKISVTMALDAVNRKLFFV